MTREARLMFVPSSFRKMTDKFPDALGRLGELVKSWSTANLPITVSAFPVLSRGRKVSFRPSVPHGAAETKFLCLNSGNISVGGKQCQYRRSQSAAFHGRQNF
jgi:hypothetical protein